MLRRLLVVAIVAVAAAGGTVHAASAPPRFQGATLSHPAAPPDFALRDQHGRLVRLSRLRGRAVLLTFLYTHCPDVCPLTAANLNSALGLLGAAQSRVDVLAVSVDPRGDTPAAVATFLRSHHLSARFHYLTGRAAALAGVWRAYRVAAVRSSRDRGVDHTLYTLLIDPAGKARVLFDVQARPRAIAHDVRLLLS